MRFGIMLFAGFLALLAMRADAQSESAEDIAHMLVTNLSPTGAMEAGQWFTNPPVPETGAVGLGIIYVHVPGSAGTVSIHAGLFLLYPIGWSIIHEITGLFGMSPSDAVFYGDRVEVTTTVLGPNDPRCCPSVAARWSIDLTNGVASQLY